jgi:hypothetical protein
MIIMITLYKSKTIDANKVLDGDIQPFILSFLKKK